MAIGNRRQEKARAVCDASANGQRSLSDLLRGAMPGTDAIVIGTSSVPEKENKIKATTVGDAAELVAGVRYLVRNWIPFGMVTGVVAEPGVGKSAFVLWLTLTIVTAGRWFTGLRGPEKPGRVLWCGTENDLAITLQRIRDWSIPMDRILLPFADDPLASVNLTCNAHLELIEALVNRYKPLAVVVDSLRGGHDCEENNSRVGRVLQSLGAIAERTNAAFLVVHHTRKLTEGEEITANSSRGSNAILALMRSQIGIDKPDPKRKWCRLRVLKENLGIAPRPIGFRVTKHGLEFGASPERPRRETVKNRAEQFLQENMKAGEWRKAELLIEDAEQQAISDDALYRARMALGIVKPGHLKKDKAGWWWKLPDGKA